MKIDRDTRSKVFLWAAGEIFIVVVGVLIAFALNAWWVDRELRQQEQAHIQALIRDFERNVGIFQELVRRQTLTADASQKLLELAKTKPDTSEDVVAPLVGDVFSSIREEPAMGAYEALINSGGLTIIRDDSLRGSLADFASRVTSRYYERFSDELYMAFTTEFVGRLKFIDAPGTRSYGSLLRDPRFQEHLALRYGSERGLKSQYERSLAQAQKILDQLKAQVVQD